MGKQLNRRKFIQQASCSAIGSTTLLSTLFNLKLMNATAMTNSSIFTGNDYKALVCILLSGGNDSYNMLIPSSSSGYQQYQDARQSLALDKNNILALNNVNFAVHPEMQQVQRLFNQNKLSFISNIGSLLEPITDKQELRDGLVKAPIDLFSHADQSQQWQTSIPNDKAALGWGGKIADILASQNENDTISMNISLAGSNVFQRGNSTLEYSIDPIYGSLNIVGYQLETLAGQLRTNMIDNIVDADYQDKYKRTYIDAVKVSRDSMLEFNAALENSTPVSTSFSNTHLSNSLKTVANIMAARSSLGMKRQIFFVESQGWDHHDYALLKHEAGLKELSDALGEFDTALQELNLQDCITTFTMSEFARTLTSNGDGTDHAWGGNVMVMGGAIKGGQIFGEYPNLELDNNRDLGGGTIIPTLSVDEYFAELSLWLGINKSELDIVFPNLKNFYSSTSNDLPIGFLNV